MKTKLSNTAVNLYNQCSLCYKLHYIDNIRPVKTSSALVFGSALDSGLNKLLLTKDLDQAIQEFENHWYGHYQDENIVYFKSDLDEELLDFKGRSGVFNKDPNWDSLRTKGTMFIEAYHKEVLPKIKKVLVVQQPISIKNSEGDEIAGFLDLIVEWEDGNTYLLDNKSSGSRYDENSAKEGQQLPLYHYAVKDQYNLAGIGYIVLIKKINKNKTKVCTKCGEINSTSHKTCPELIINDPVLNGSRCNGKFEITINPTVDIQYVINPCEESDENRILEVFDKANHGISNKQFAEEHSPVRGKYGWCPYKEYYPDNSDFIVKERK